MIRQIQTRLIHAACALLALAALVVSPSALALTSQTITFGTISAQSYGTTLTLSATASSGLPVAFTSTTTSVCTVSGSTVSYVATGTCTIDANQAGNATYTAAPQVKRSFTINNGIQTITFPAIANVSYGVAPFTLNATNNPSNTVSFSSSTTSVCTVSGATASIVGVGTCTITAGSGPLPNYGPGGPVSQSFTVSAANQTVTFPTPVNMNIGGSSQTLGATASSGLQVTYTVQTPSVCSPAGQTGVNAVAAGTCTIAANQSGNADYNAATQVTQSFTVLGEAQTITFSALSSKAYGSAPFAVSASSSSGLAVAFSSGTTGVCTVSGSTVTLVAGGTCSIIANQTGNSTYAAATSVTQSFTVTPIAQTISFAALGSQVYGAAPFAVSATASSGLSVAFSSATTGVCTVSGSTVTIAGAGTCTIDANQAGSASYNAATQVGQSFTVTPASQTVSFTAPGNSTYGSTVVLSGSASSGLGVAYTSATTSVCTVSGSNATMVGVGTCTINANQAGNANYSAASQVSHSFSASQAAQSISFPTLSNPAYGSTVPLSATASSSLAVSFASSTTSVCTVSGSNLTIVGSGTCTVSANQAGNADYAAASSVSQSVTVTQVPQTISFTAPGNSTYGAAIALSASATSGLAVTFSSATGGVCTVSGNSATMVGVGTCTINANQAGNGGYTAAPQVSQSFTVAQASQSIGFTAPAATPYGGSVTLSATATSGLAVTFASATTSICTVSGNSATIVGVGTCTINSNQAGNSSYAAAPQVSQSFSSTQATQTITFAALANSSYGNAVTLTATASSGLSVAFTSATTGVCTVAGNTVTVVTSGTCTINANQAGNADYSAAAQVSQSFSATQAAQTISFTAPANVAYGSGPVTLNATASSGLAVTYASSTTAVCTVSGASVSLIAPGTCTIAASQSGNANYNAAQQVTQSFTIAQASQTLSFSALGNKILGQPAFTVSATASSALTVGFTSTTTAICTTGGTNGSTVTLLAAGTCTIVASQPGNANYAAASSVSQNFSVSTDAAPSVSISSPSAGQSFAAPASITLTANASSSDASITQVQFYNGTTLVGSATQAPYSVTWSNVASGSYSVTAVATDSLGASATSAALPVTVALGQPSTAGNWQSQTMPTPAVWWSAVAYGQGKFVALPWNGGAPASPSYTSYAAYSNDNGATWHNSWLPYNNWWSGLAYGNGVFVGVSYNGSSTAVVSPDGVTWSSYNTMPGANWNSITYGNGTFVAIADSGSIAATSPDGIHWTQQTLPASAQWISVTYGNGVFVAIAGNSNISATSPDGVTWTQQTLPINTEWSSVTYGNGTFVAIGFSNAANGVSYSAVSPDGINWTTSTLPTPGSWRNVAYGGGLFVAVTGGGGNVTFGNLGGGNVGNLNLAATSVDGINWNSSTLPTSAYWLGLAYGDNTFMTVGSQGASFTDATLTVAEATPPTIAITSPTAGQSLFTSTPINLTVNAASSGAAIAQVQYFNGSTLIGTATQAPYSLTWNNIPSGNLTLTAVVTDALAGSTTSAPVSITVLPAVTVTLTGSNIAASGGYTLTLNAAVSDLVGNVTQVAFYNGAALLGTATQAPYSVSLPNLAPGNYFITAQVSDSTGLSASANAQFDLGPSQYSTAGSWQSQTMASPADWWSAVAYGQGKFVVLPWTGGGFSNAAYSTNNGVTWNYMEMPFGDRWSSIAYGNGVFVGVAYGSNSVTVSQDGVTWNLYSMPLGANWSSITYGNGTFVAIADSGSIAATSPDGIHWTQQTLPASAQWISVTYGNGVFVAIAGNSNISATSPDGVTWTQHTLPINTEWSSITYGSGTFVAIGFSNGSVSATYPNGVSYSAVSPDGINWTASNLPTPSSWRSVAYGGGLFVAIAGAGGNVTFNNLGGGNNGTVNLAATSVDGINWNSGTLPTSAYWEGLVYGNGTFLAIGGQQNASSLDATLPVVVSAVPTLTITSPTAGQAFAGPATITLTASATNIAPGATVTQVQYFNGSTLIGSAIQAPYSVVWNNPAEGSYSITAQATDSHGGFTVSAPIAFQVSLPIQVAITSPANGAQVSGKNLTVSASASVSGTTITQVSFYNGQNLMGTLTQPPYSIVFPDIDPGSYGITAQATDSLGLTSTSSAVSITVLPDGQVGGGVGSGGQAVYDIHTDQLGTPRMVTDQGGNIVWQWDNLDPFGYNLPNQNPNGTGNQFIFNLRYPGMYSDIETGTFYNGFRDYDPSIGRYPESDPIGLKGGINTYAYTGSNPLTRSDETGLYYTCRFVGFGVVCTWVNPNPDPENPPAVANSGGDWGLQRAIEEEANRRQYKRECDEPPPPGGNKCDDAQFRLKQALRCKAARKENTDKWWGGIDAFHDPIMPWELDNRIKNAERAVKQECQCPPGK